jgi:hypothetical protein
MAYHKDRRCNYPLNKKESRKHIYFGEVQPKRNKVNRSLASFLLRADILKDPISEPQIRNLKMTRDLQTHSYCKKSSP